MQQIKLWPAMLVSHATLTEVLAAPLLIQFPSNALAEAGEDGPKVCWSLPPMENTQMQRLAPNF